MKHVSYHVFRFSLPEVSQVIEDCFQRKMMLRTGAFLDVRQALNKIDELKKLLSRPYFL